MGFGEFRLSLFHLAPLSFVDIDSKDCKVVERALLDSIISMSLFIWLADGLHGGD
jgi:hypothetical protein